MITSSLSAAEVGQLVSDQYPCVASPQLPTIFHVTHWKSGSQWIHRIFHGIAYDRLILPRVDQSQFFQEPIRPGMIYPTIYATRQEFESIKLPSNSRRFIVIRDLRDTLVSYTFSMLYSHGEDASLPGFLADFRKNFLHRPICEVMNHVMDSMLPKSAEIQASWLNQGELILRYDDLLNGDIELLSTTLIDHCQLDIPREKLVEVLIANRFESITGGRKRGNENVAAHERKGIAGDWRNFFTPQLVRDFKARYAELLIATGCERNADWNVSPKS